ncbi:MAG TPA: tetratricopeptide repeat protein [Candidatus Acidoferrum sp.]|nr:tetratricopeptide repeat protein [Candidatus Acidoferrum sp.]
MSLDPLDSRLPSPAPAATSSAIASTSHQATLAPKLSLQIALLLGVTLLIYANSLLNDFTMDDELYIQKNAQVTQHSFRLLFQPNAASNVFRPVTFATLALNWIVAGYKPFGYHLVNLLLQAAVAVLLLAVLRKLLEGATNYEFICFAAAMLFAVHPIHTEAVSSVVGRSELLAAGFLLAAWLFHLQDRYILALLGFALALLSKESAIGLLPLALAGDYAKGQLKPWTRYAGIATLTLVYIGALWKVQGGHFGAPSVSVLDNPLTLLPAGLRILNAVRIAWKYIGLLIFPATLSCDYSYNQITLFANWQHLLLPILGALTVAALWIWTVCKRSAGLLLAGAIYFTGFAATSNILTRTGTIFGERLAYLPSAGFCLLAAMLFAWLVFRQRIAGLAVLALVIGAFSVRTVARNRDWKDNGSLYMVAADAVPNSAKMRTFRGIVYMGRGQLERSRADLNAALRINPEYPDAIEAMGLLELRGNNQQAALDYLQRALQVSAPADFDYDYRAANLTALQIQMGKLDDAMKLLNRRIAESPDYSRLWSNRAALRLKLGEAAEAREDARRALRLDPNNLQARNLLEHGAPGSPH